MVNYVTKQRESRDARGGLCLDENECNYFFRQLIWAVQFCHDHHVAHRCARWRAGGALICIRFKFHSHREAKRSKSQPHGRRRCERRLAAAARQPPPSAASNFLPAI